MQRHGTGALHSPLIVLLEEDGTQEPDDGISCGSCRRIRPGDSPWYTTPELRRAKQACVALAQALLDKPFAGRLGHSSATTGLAGSLMIVDEAQPGGCEVFSPPPKVGLEPILQASVAHDILAFAVWIGGQMLAVSLTRSDFAASLRYVDIFIGLLPINFLAIMLWLNELSSARSAKLIRVYLVLWGVVIATAVLVEAYFGPGQALQNWKITTDHAEATVQDFLQTNDPAGIIAMGSLIYPDPQRVISILQDPVAREIVQAQSNTKVMAVEWWLSEALKLWIVPVALAFGLVFGFLLQSLRRNPAATA